MYRAVEYSWAGVCRASRCVKVGVSAATACVPPTNKQHTSAADVAHTAALAERAKNLF